MKDIVITILTVLVLCLGGYLVYDKLINREEAKDNGVTDNQQNNIITNQYEVINSNDTLVQTLYNNTKGLQKGDGDAIYVTKYLSAQDRSYEDKLCLVIQTANNVYNETNIKQLYEKVYGVNSYRRLENLNCPCTTYVFDSSKTEYKIDQDGCGFNGGYEDKIDEVRKYNDKIEIITTYYYEGIDSNTGNYRVCTDINCNNVLSETQEYVEINAFEQYKNQLNKLTYTYNLAENGSYYYYSTEINK